MPFQGMNTEELRKLAQLMTTASEELGSAIGRVSQALRTSTWKGSDAAHIEDDWRRHRDSLADAARFLSGAAQTMRNSAQQQENVSDAG